MERATFLLESTGTRISCLLNPETLILRRAAGVRPRRISGGKLAGTPLRDDPLIVVGGGRTEIHLDLLFDIDLAGSSQVVEDVRELTRPLWELAETRAAPGTPPEPLLFVWGKAWSIPAVVDALSERLERFDASGLPSRSWMRIRLLRVDWTLDPARAENRRPDAEALSSAAGGGGAADTVEEAMLLSEFMTGSPNDWREFLE
jgi:hypothetical protein